MAKTLTVLPEDYQKFQKNYKEENLQKNFKKTATKSKTYTHFRKLYKVLKT